MVLCARRRRSGGGAPAEAVSSQALQSAERRAQSAECSKVQHLGPDKIRNRPDTAATVGGRSGLSGGRALGRVGPGEAWKEAHAQAWDSAGRVPGAWKTGLA